LRLEAGALPKPRTVLFVCRYNSARSQLAEALARRRAGDRLRVLSAGLERTIVNEEVLRALAENGIDAGAQRSKTLEDVAGEAVDDVVVLAEPAWLPAARCFPRARHHFWCMDDPVAAADPARVPAEVRRTRDEIDARLARWLSEEGLCR
jgi:arsenate reductase